MPNKGYSPTTPPSDSNLTGSDAHGKAALLLAESLVHGLCENNRLSTKDAIDIVDRAASVQHERATESESGGASNWQSHALLVAIANSLKTDLSTESFNPRLVP